MFTRVLYCVRAVYVLFVNVNDNMTSFSQIVIQKMNFSVPLLNIFFRNRLAQENGKKRNEVTACMLTKWVMHKSLVPENIFFYMSKGTGGLILTARKFARLCTLILTDNLQNVRTINNLSTTFSYQMKNRDEWKLTMQRNISVCFLSI